jgi:AraC-like DNA-binding protein
MKNVDSNRDRDSDFVCGSNLINFEGQMKNVSDANLKVDDRMVSQCEAITNGRAAASDNGFASENNGSLDKQRATSSSRRCESETARKIEQSINYMRQNLDKPLQAPALAALVNISPSHYFALFKHHTGRAPIDYFTRLRMQCACRLLHSTPSSVKEIADSLGYADPFYFSRVFKSVNRIAPSKYRMQQKDSSVEDRWKNTGRFSFQPNKQKNFPDMPGWQRQRKRAVAFSSACAEKCVA